jgi:hypothetical protein
MSLDEWKLFLRQTDILETEILARSSNGELAKAILRKSQRQIDQGVSWRVFKRAGFRCEYCGNDGVPLTVDHLICWESGGPSIEENMASACRKCNKMRGNTDYAAWLKHPYYLKVSKSISHAQSALNESRVDLIKGIDRVYVRSR